MATITVTDLATALSTDSRTARKFLRTITPKDAQPGKGSRWAIEARQVRSLTSQFKKFTAAQDEIKANRAEKAAAPAAEVNLDIEENDDLEVEMTELD